MRLEYLGDAFDHWKGSILEVLRRASCASNLVAVPLLTDAGQWSPEHLEVYRRHLRLSDDSALLAATKVAVRDPRIRKAYFDFVEEELHRRPDCHDLFIDPDKGVETPGGNCSKEHVAVGEVNRLAGEERLVLVFEQSRNYSTSHSAHAADLRDRFLRRGLQTVVWAGRQVAMVAASRSSARVEAVRRVWSHMVGPLAAQMVF